MVTCIHSNVHSTLQDLTTSEPYGGDTPERLKRKVEEGDVSALFLLDFFWPLVKGQLPTIQDNSQAVYSFSCLRTSNVRLRRKPILSPQTCAPLARDGEHVDFRQLFMISAPTVPLKEVAPGSATMRGIH